MSATGERLPCPSHRPKCRACDRPVDRNTAAVRNGYCSGPACEAERVHEVADAILGREWDEFRDQTRAVLTRAAPAIATVASETGRPVDDYALMAIPHQPGGQVDLTGERCADFLAHLDRAIEDAFHGPPPDPPTAHRRRIDAEEAPLIEAACTTCKGRCCEPGADHHAFVNADTIRQYRAYHPDLDADAIREAYAGRLPDRHTEGSCIFHGSQGCTLDRTQRAEICNVHHCRALAFLLETEHVRSAGPFLIVASDQEEAQAIAVYSGETGRSEVEPEAVPQLSASETEDIVRLGLAPLPEECPLLRGNRTARGAAPRDTLSTDRLPPDRIAGMQE